MKKKLFFIAFIIPVLGFGKEIRVLELNRAASTMTLINYSNQTINFNNYQCSIEGTYFPLFSKPLVSGSLLMAPMGTAKLSSITLPDLTPGASVSLWFPNSLPANANTQNMLDFLQYGSTGHTYESLAITKGIWTAGDKISYAFPYLFTGDSLDYGSAYYITGGIGFAEYSSGQQVQVMPNPATVYASIVFTNDFSRNKPVEFELMRSDGMLVRRSHEITVSGMMIETQDLPVGFYFIRLFNSEKRSALIKLIKN